MTIERKSTQSVSRFKLIRFREKVAGTFVGTGNQISLTRKKYTIGSSPRCDIILREENVEERHTTLFVEIEEVSIIDLDSINGTLVNNQRISGKKQLFHMDEIKVGQSRFLFVDNSFPFDSDLLEDFFDENLPSIKSDLEYTLKREHLTKINDKTKKAPDIEGLTDSFLQILEEIVSGYSLPELLEKILDFLFQKFPADRGFILLLDPQSQQLLPVATRSNIRQGEKSRLAISKTLLNRVWKEREALLICDMGGLKTTERSKSIMFHGFTSILIAPLIFSDEFLGILQIDTIDHKRQLSEDDLYKMQAYCHVAALAIGNTRLQEKLWEEKHVRQTLSRYLPRKLIDQVITNENLIPPEGAHWNVAVFFADIRGFSKMTGRLPAADVIEILNEYYSEVSDCIFEHSGMISQFVGDEVMAIFGGPWISDKDFNPAEAAVQAARDVIRQICRMNVERHEAGKETIFVGVGVDYGRVLMGNLGSTKKFEFTAVGNTVVIANRLCSAAKESQILVTDRVTQNLKKDMTMEKMPPTIAKNVKDPIETYRIFWNR